MLVDQHLHLEKGPYTPDDYPLEWVERYLEVASSRGVSRLGIVEHAYRFREAKGLLDNPWADARCRFMLDPYLGFVERVRSAGLPVSFGLEMDFVPGQEEGIRAFLARYPWDFVLGSVHFVGAIGIDMEEDRRRIASWPARRIWDEYFETSLLAVRSGLFDVLTHPDLPKIFGERAAHDLGPDFERLVAALVAADVALEMNTAGWRKPVGEAYPERRYLEAAWAAGLPVSLASDAHVPSDAGRDFARAMALLTSVGYREAVHFVGRERRLSPLLPETDGD